MYNIQIPNQNQFELFIKYFKIHKIDEIKYQNTLLKKYIQL